MSVQLILYPQFFNGLNPLNNYQLEFIIDGASFLTIDSSTSYTSTQSNALLDALTNEPPAIQNQWYRFRSSDAGTPSFPENSSNKLKLYKDTTETKSGVYQRLSNLNVGQDYTLEVVISTGTSDFLELSVYDGTTVVQQGSVSSATGTVSITFTAASTNDIIALTYTNPSGTSSGHILIDNISVQPTGSQPNLNNGQVLLDVYEDEDIPLTLSIDNFKNVAEKVQSYSKAFKLPATKRNNQIFDNIFDIIRADDGLVFNPYRKTKCEVKQNGFILIEGYLRLIDINEKDNETSYNVNIYSEVIALADFLKEKTFKDIDFTELEHEYTKTNIKYSWNDATTGITYTNANTSGFRNAYDTVKYPFVDWEHKYSTSSAGNPDMESLGVFFRPWLQIKYLIQRIFDDSPFTFESTFFDTTDFEQLYMDFNWGGEGEPHDNEGTGTGTNESTTGNVAGTSYSRLIFDTETFSDESLIGFDISNSRFTAQFDNQYYSVDFGFRVSYNGLSSPSTAGQIYGSVVWREFDSGGNFVSDRALVNLVSTGDGNTSGARNVIGTFSATLPNGNYLIPMFKRESIVTNLTQVHEGGYGPGIPDTVVVVGQKNILNSTLVDNLRGGLQQWEFLKGIINMFNLVTIPDKDSPNNILIEPYSDVFIEHTSSGNTSDLTLSSRSIQHDWTEKIDASEIKLSPLTDLNKITKFIFAEDEDDYAYSVYKRATSGYMYGSKIFDASGFTVLDGDKEISAEPFAATIIKPLEPQYNDLIIPTIYSKQDDGYTAGFDNSPRICYNVGKKTLSSCTYSIPGQNGDTGNAAEDEFLQFAHLTDVPTAVSSPPAATDTRDFHFGGCQYFKGVGETSTRNLFNLYWLPYYAELYHPDTRTMEVKVNLTPGDIGTLNMYDTVFIKNRQYRINKIDYKPNDLAKVEFILVP